VECKIYLQLFWNAYLSGNRYIYLTTLRMLPPSWAYYTFYNNVKSSLGSSTCILTSLLPQRTSSISIPNPTQLWLCPCSASLAPWILQEYIRKINSSNYHNVISCWKIARWSPLRKHHSRARALGCFGSSRSTSKGISSANSPLTIFLPFILKQQPPLFSISICGSLQIQNLEIFCIISEEREHEGDSIANRVP
jgi:hypothetical protein